MVSPVGDVVPVIRVLAQPLETTLKARSNGWAESIIKGFPISTSTCYQHMQRYGPKSKPRRPREHRISGSETGIEKWVQ